MSKGSADSVQREKAEQGSPNRAELDELVWASAGGCGPAIDSAEAWTRMGDTCCGDDGDEQ